MPGAVKSSQPQTPSSPKMVTQQQEAEGRGRWEQKVRNRGGKMLSQTQAKLDVPEDPAGLRTVALCDRADETVMYVKPEEVSYYTDPFTKPLRLGGFRAQNTRERLNAEARFVLYDPSTHIKKTLSLPLESASTEGRPARRRRKRKRGRRG